LVGDPDRRPGAAHPRPLPKIRLASSSPLLTGRKNSADDCSPPRFQAPLARCCPARDGCLAGHRVQAQEIGSAQVPSSSASPTAMRPVIGQAAAGVGKAHGSAHRHHRQFSQ
jgi:hypothetical protein